MTTNVTIKTVEWPVRVVYIDPKTRLKLKHRRNDLVDSNDEKTVYITDQEAIIVTELKHP